jgi:hypothetical protein
MATTTNYAWETPDDTDLVKDGALAIRTLGSSIDTTTKALNPSTTLGDIEYRSSTANTNTRLAIGTSGQVLSVSGGVPTWTTPAAAGGWTLLATKTLSGSTTNTISSISQSYNSLYLIVNGMTQTSNGVIDIRLNGNTSLYAWSMVDRANTTTTTYSSHDATTIPFAGYNVSATQAINGAFLLHNYTSTYAKMFHSFGRGQDSGSNLTTNISSGLDRNTAAITSISIISATNATAGTAYLYGI